MRISDFQHVVMEWLTFERENGSLAEYDVVYTRATKFFQQVSYIVRLRVRSGSLCVFYITPSLYLYPNCSYLHVTHRTYTPR
jgi:hypothetical protein